MRRTHIGIASSERRAILPVQCSKTVTHWTDTAVSSRGRKIWPRKTIASFHHEETPVMPHAKNASDHHHNAAKHHEHAAKHHKLAAEHHANGEHAKAAHHARVAHGHHLNAEHHHHEAAKHFAEQNSDTEH